MWGSVPVNERSDDAGGTDCRGSVSEASVISDALTEQLTPKQAAIVARWMRDRHEAPTTFLSIAREQGIERRAAQRLLLEGRVRVLMALVRAYRAGAVDEVAPRVDLDALFHDDENRRAAYRARHQRAEAQGAAGA